ncbi:hypothetical protein IDJ77_11440 [Mucilaginibacter sp. ZT4R22]|uniref:LETM1-like protein n=1 Tax=Mucilaginibacter pankratovii TaxID=2772110 RepID=A0ABR7WQ43_9SPHI|nr:hypothetical protein [Mucilaginibacter pankratovii]MBD1364422.1 hypothetical protein [Mucilaginibacter pankratovii]
MVKSFHLRNLEFFDFINHTLNLRQLRTWDDLSKSLTELKIKLIYRKFAEIFPRRDDYVSELSSLPDGFKTIHYSTLKGTTIIDEIVRFSLYSDSIIVFHPLQNPAITNQQMNPGRNPKLWIPDFINAIYFYIVIQKWVRAGIVQLVINPFEYNDDWFKRISEQTKMRFETINKDDVVFNEVELQIAEQLAAFYSKENTLEEIKAGLLKMENPKFSEDQAVRLANEIKDAIPKVNPLYTALPKHFNGSQIMTTKGGGPLESITEIAELIGGNIYTPNKLNWKMLQEVNKNEFWLKLNHIYSQVDIPFLNNVSTDFALSLREEDRLSGVRTELKKLFSELNQLQINQIDEKKVGYLYESFKDEIRKTESEWTAIKKESSIIRQHLTISAAVIPVMVAQPVSILPLALITGNILVNSLRTAGAKQSAFKVKNPISVFIDAKHKPEGFFANLRSCIV